MICYIEVLPIKDLKIKCWERRSKSKAGAYALCRLRRIKSYRLCGKDDAALLQWGLRPVVADANLKDNTLMTKTKKC